MYHERVLTLNTGTHAGSRQRLGISLSNESDDTVPASGSCSVGGDLRRFENVYRCKSMLSLETI